MSEKNNEIGFVDNMETLAQTDMNKIDICVNDVTKVPSLISQREERLKELKEAVEAANEMASEAKERADAAKKLETGLGKKKTAIEGLQNAQVEIANALVMQSKAQQSLQEYQTFLTQTVEGLFAIGVTSIAMNRAVVRELEIRLKEGSDSENTLDELAKKEIANVITQLKAQEDIMVKQEMTLERVKENRQRIINLQKKDSELDFTIAEQAFKDEEHDRALAEQAEKDAEHDRELAEHAEKDAEHDRKLAEQAEKDAGHDRELAEQAEKDAEHDRKLAEQAEKDAEHDRELAEQAEKDAEHDRELAEQAEKDAEHDKLLKEQSDEITELKNQIENLKLELSAKVTKKAFIISSAILAVAIAADIVITFVVK